MKKLCAVLIAVAILAGWETAPQAQRRTRTARPILRQAATGQLTRPVIVTTSGGNVVVRRLPFLSGSTLAAARGAVVASDERELGADAGIPTDLPFPDPGSFHGTLGCGHRDDSGNTRVNQDCGFRRQAETGIAFNPTNRRNLIAGMNDSRVGYNQCGIAFSIDNGEHWGDLLPPFRQRLNDPAAEEPTLDDPNRHTILGGDGTFHTYDAGSDPALAFDSHGRAFFSCVTFDIASNASMVYVTQSPLGAQGSFFFTLAELGRHFMVVEDNGNVFHDKEFIAADPYPSSPNRDNVYVTWTVFDFTCGTGHDEFCGSPIYGSMSSDHGLTWSTPEKISGISQNLCFFGDFFDPTQDPHACNFDQGSEPTVLPNGDLAVVFNNGNTPAGNPNAQQLSVLCHPAGSSPAGTAHLNCGTPSKVGDDLIVNEPTCDFGRGPEECVAGPFVRTDDYPRVAVNRANGHLFAAWQDYRSGEYDIQMARSTDGGLTWSPSVTVNPDTGLDHYLAAVSVAERADRDRVGVSYYRSQITAPGDAWSDYVLGGGTNIAAPFKFKVVSPVFAPPDGIQAGFIGDYSGLTITDAEEAHPIWADTRNVDPYAPANGVLHDEDVFTDKLPLPDGPVKTGVGHIGKP